MRGLVVVSSAGFGLGSGESGLGSGESGLGSGESGAESCTFSPRHVTKLSSTGVAASGPPLLESIP